MNNPKKLILKYILTIVLIPLVSEIHGQNGFSHRGYLGWMIDLSQTASADAWPSIRIDSALLADYEETLDFLQRTGMNEITLWGLFTNKYWEPDIDKTIDESRKELVRRIIEMAHKRNLKLINGMGIYSWGFDKILEKNPSLRCQCNNHVMDLSNPDSWQWQKKVLDYVIDNFDFDGISMQSADLGRCSCGQSAHLSDMEYNALVNQKAISYIRIKKPEYIIGISGWGMNLGKPADLKYVEKMTQKADYLIDVEETALEAGREYRRRLIHSIAPCRYGNTAAPNIEPIQAMPRDLYFIPATYHACQRLKDIFDDGGLACEAYARTRGNPGDKVTIEVIAKILSDPGYDITKALNETLDFIYGPYDKDALSELSDIFREAENAFFRNYHGSDRELIQVMPRTQSVPESTYFKIMSPSSKIDYTETISSLFVRANALKGKVKNEEELNLLISCLANILHHTQSSD